MILEILFWDIFFTFSLFKFTQDWWWWIIHFQDDIGSTQVILWLCVKLQDKKWFLQWIGCNNKVFNDCGAENVYAQFSLWTLLGFTKFRRKILALVWQMNGGKNCASCKKNQSWTDRVIHSLYMWLLFEHEKGLFQASDILLYPRQTPTVLVIWSTMSCLVDSWVQQPTSDPMLEV